MAVSRLLPSGGANDFNLAIAGAYTSVIFNKEYASGSYSIISNSADPTFDIYAYNSDGSLAAYTNTGSFTASKGFIKIVVLGGTTGDVFSFSYKTTFISVDDSDEVTAGPVATSASPSSVPNIDDTFTLTGRNFATDCTVTFTSANAAYPSTQAKGIVRSSETSLIVTRPDNLVTTYSPYTITVENPGVINPTGSNSHILSNSITAGTNPAWVTSTPLTAFTKNSAYSLTLVASDTEASDIDYSIITGSLPAGLSLNEETGVISGTPSGSTSASFTVRATDAGGNYVDRAFTHPNSGPVWSTAETLTAALTNTAYSQTLTATDDSGVAPTYGAPSGSLPTGLSYNTSTGVISGTPTVGGTSTFTITATDANGTGTSRTFSLSVASLIQTSFTSVGSNTFNYPANAVANLGVQYLVAGGGGSGGDGNAPGGGGGAGGLCIGTLTNLTPGTSYTAFVGAGANNNGGNDQPGNNGTASYFVSTSTVYANGGGRGGGYSGAPGNGGSGGGGSGPSNQTGGGSSIGNIATGGTAYGNSGGASFPGGGGGAGSAGGIGYAGAGRTDSFTGSSYTYCAGGYNAGQNGSNYGDGGGRGTDSTPGNGRQGVIHLRYYA